MTPAGSCAWSSADKNAIAKIFTRYSGYQAAQFIVRTHKHVILYRTSQPCLGRARWDRPVLELSLERG